MASIWKHPKSINWFAKFRGAAGKYVNRSTGVAEEEEAKRIAQSWQIEAARERAKATGSDVSSGGISDALAKAERLARQGRLDAASAREVMNSLLVAAGQQRIDAVTNRLWCDGWKAGKKGAVKQKSEWKYEQVCRDWLAFLNGKADRPLEAIGRAEAIAFRDRLSSEGLSPRTVNQTVKLIRGIYAGAVEEGHVGRNPFAGIKGLRDEDDKRRQPFTAAEVGALIRVAQGDWKGLVLLSATTGLRLMDAARLKWHDLDSEEKLIRTKTSKTGATLILPMHKSFCAWLSRQQRGIGTAAVFPSLAHKSGAGKSGLSLAFKKLMNQADILGGVARERKGRGRATSRKSFHSLRHFASTALATNGVRAEVARQITGHSDAESHANYINADLNALRGAVNAIKLSA